MTRTKANIDVRKRAKKAGVYLWQIAAAIGVSETTFNRRMRVEMPEAEAEYLNSNKLPSPNEQDEHAEYAGIRPVPVKLRGT